MRNNYFNKTDDPLISSVTAKLGKVREGWSGRAMINSKLIRPSSVLTQ